MNMQKVVAELRASADELEQLERGASAADMVDELKAEIERLERELDERRYSIESEEGTHFRTTTGQTGHHVTQICCISASCKTQ